MLRWVSKPCREEFFWNPVCLVIYRWIKEHTKASAFTVSLGIDPASLVVVPNFNSHSGIPQNRSSVYPMYFPVPVLYIQLHPGADLLFRLPACELWAQDAAHDGSLGGLQHHLPPHSRSPPGWLQPGPVREVTCFLSLLFTLVLLWDVGDRRVCGVTEWHCYWESLCESFFEVVILEDAMCLHHRLHSYDLGMIVDDQ